MILIVGCGGGGGSSSRHEEWTKDAKVREAMVDDLANIRPGHPTNAPPVQCAAQRFEQFITAHEFARSLRYHQEALRKYLIACEPAGEREEDEEKRRGIKKSEEENPQEKERHEKLDNEEFERQEAAVSANAH